MDPLIRSSWNKILNDRTISDKEKNIIVVSKIRTIKNRFNYKQSQLRHAKGIGCKKGKSCSWCHPRDLDSYKKLIDRNIIDYDY